MKWALTAVMVLVAGTNAQESSSRTAELLPATTTRSRQASRDLVDLTDYYTASLDDAGLVKAGPNLSSLPQGVQIFAQAAFDVHGIIQLGGKAADRETGGKFLQAIKGIRVTNKGTSLHFLQGTIGRVKADTKIGDYVIHYTNGLTASLPIIYQRHVSDWLFHKGDPLPTDAGVAWTNESEPARPDGRRIQIYNYTARNPFPEVEITSIDMVSARTESRPFLVAISMEKNGPGYRKSFRKVRIDNAIVARSPAADPELVDLSNYFNTSLDDDWINYPGHDFQDVPKGVQTFAGVTFDVRGMVALASGTSLSSSRVLFPEAVKGIKVHRKGQKLHFLQGCGYRDKPGAKLGEYVVLFANGQMRSIPIVYQKNVLDWWCKPEDAPPTEAAEAWRGQNPSSRNAGQLTHLLKYTWENPLPDVEISTIDFTTDFATAIPFLIAVTVE